MPRGGARVGSGRKPLWSQRRCRLIARAVRRRVQRQGEFRRLRWERRNQAPYFDALREIEAYQSQLKEVPPALRRSLLKDPLDTELEEIQLYFEDGIPRQSLIPAPNKRDIHKIYETVAKIATRYFKEDITTEQVESCVKSWRAFENSV
jgi:hypothetical protein